MTSSERNARAYCLSIGADPDEMIWAIDDDLRVRGHRWQFYVPCQFSVGGVA